MKYTILIITLLTSAFTYASAPLLPISWLEQTPSIEKSANTNLERPTNEADEEIDYLFNTQHKILNKLEKNKNKKWKVTDYVFMLSLTKQGLLGFKALNGKSVFQIYYQKKSDKEVITPAQEQIDLYVHDQMSDAELKDQIGPALNALVDADKIEHNQQLEDQIITKINQIKKVVGNLQSETNHKFYLSAFRIDLGINRSGMLIPGWMAQKGTEVILRLQWGRMMRKESTQVIQKSSLSASKFEKFANAILQDLDKVDETPLEGTGKKAVKIRIGMGITTTEQIIISNSKTTFSGNLIFQRNKKYKPTKSQHLNNYNYTIDKSGELSVIPSAKMIKGLNKAVKMGSYFVKKADNSKKWNVSMLRAWYIIDKTGFLGLAPITGTSEIEFFYK